MISHLLIAQLIPQAFLGGSGLDLAKMYVNVTHRSAVVSERVVFGYGPTRFRKDAIGNVQMSDTFIKTIHNSVREQWKLPNGSPTEGLVVFPNVDALRCSIYPPQIAGVLPTDAMAEIRERMTHPGTLKLAVFPNPRALTGTGTDSIKNLVNLGLSKSLSFPALFGDLWFSTTMVYVSEVDFLNAIAQLADCTLKVNQSSYVLEPNAEEIRSRFLNTLSVLGTETDDLEGVRTKIRYRAYQLAPAAIIEECVSEPKLFKEVAFPNDPEMKSLCERLKVLALEKYVKSGRSEKREFKPRGQMRFAYGYSFSIGVLVEMSDGAFWMM